LIADTYAALGILIQDSVRLAVSCLLHHRVAADAKETRSPI
jgi:hypothetical protein